MSATDETEPRCLECLQVMGSHKRTCSHRVCDQVSDYAPAAGDAERERNAAGAKALVAKWTRERIFADIAAECERQDAARMKIEWHLMRGALVEETARFVRAIEALDRKAGGAT